MALEQVDSYETLSDVPITSAEIHVKRGGKSLRHDDLLLAQASRFCLENKIVFGFSFDDPGHNLEFASRAGRLYRRRHGVSIPLGNQGIHEGTGLGTLGVCFNGV